MSLRDNLTNDEVVRLRSAPLVRISPDDVIEEVIAQMRFHNTGCALVCEQNRLIGVFTERDVMRIIAEGADLSQPVAAEMTAEPATIALTAPVAEAVMQMHRGGYRRLPVVDGDGVAASLVSLKSVMHYLVEHFPSSVYNLPPVSRPMTKDREGA